MELCQAAWYRIQWTKFTKEIYSKAKKRIPRWIKWNDVKNECTKNGFQMNSWGSNGGKTNGKSWPKRFQSLVKQANEEKR